MWISFRRSPSSILVTGMPVHDATTLGDVFLGDLLGQQTFAVQAFPASAFSASASFFCNSGMRPY